MVAAAAVPGPGRAPRLGGGIADVSFKTTDDNAMLRVLAAPAVVAVAAVASRRNDRIRLHCRHCRPCRLYHPHCPRRRIRGFHVVSFRS